VIDNEPGNARIVQLKAGRPGPCLFLVPGTGGSIEGFATLAATLRTPMPVFAIEARGIDESSTPDTNVEEMALHYLARIRTVQGAGPYFLAGHSFGGLVALEMAQRLIDAKQSVACLIMLDTPISERYWPFPFYLKNLKARVRRHVKRILTISISENLKFYSRRLSLRRADLSQMPTDVLIGTNVARVLIANTIARQNYSPKFYPDKLIFFRSCEGNDFEGLWPNLVRELEICSSDGGHISMIEPPYVSSLAANISECLARALEGATPAPTSPLDS
jgi:acetoacetyl-CoA synthetase